MTGAYQRNDYLAQTHAVVTELSSLVPSRPFAVRLPDGAVIPPNQHPQSPSFTLVLHDPSRLRRMFLPPSELALGESYIFGDVDIEGDIVAAFSFIDQLTWPRPSLGKLVQLAWKLWRLERNGRSHRAKHDPGGTFSAYADQGRRHSAARDQRASQFHYDVSSRFYKLWLDERMVYSCAYFADPDDSLEKAQLQKLERICQKLNLQPGERFLDIGCGFGGLLMHAAAEHGVEACGISLSQAQTNEARRRIEAAGLTSRCRIEICHYEQFEPKASFDKIASTGMVGHVSKTQLAGYFAKAHQLLKPGGYFLVEGGAARIDRRHAGRRWMERFGLGRNAFTHKYSFPDTQLNDIVTVIQKAEMAGFETRNLESLREHYPPTLRHWLNRLEQNRERAIDEVGPVAYRSWRLILAGFLHLLDKGQLTVYQTLLTQPAV